MTNPRCTYYVVKTGPNSFDLRQTRYKLQLEQGFEHPHDIITKSASREGMLDLLSSGWFFSTDCSAMDLP